MSVQSLKGYTLRRLAKFVSENIEDILEELKGLQRYLKSANVMAMAYSEVGWYRWHMNAYTESGEAVEPVLLKQIRDTVRNSNWQYWGECCNGIDICEIPAYTLKLCDRSEIVDAVWQAGAEVQFLIHEAERIARCGFDMEKVETILRGIFVIENLNKNEEEK